MADNSIDIVLTDPPYLYLKHKLDRPFDEQTFFAQCKRILKDDGFVVMFGRGTSFYRWNTILEQLGFVFKEEIIWSKGQHTSPLMPINRVHETISIYCKSKKGKIQKVKVPYLEMKAHNIDSIVMDLKRMRQIFTKVEAMKAVLDYIENNLVKKSEAIKQNGLTISSPIASENRCLTTVRTINDGMNEKSIIRSDFKDNDKFTKYGLTGKRMDGERCVNTLQSIDEGMNEQSIIKQVRDHYKSVHPTQKPVRLLERLLALVAKKGDVVFDPFGGSFSTMEAVLNMGLNGISCEIDPLYFNEGQKRIEQYAR